MYFLSADDLFFLHLLPDPAAIYRPLFDLFRIQKKPIDNGPLLKIKYFDGAFEWLKNRKLDGERFSTVYVSRSKKNPREINPSFKYKYFDRLNYRVGETCVFL